MWHTFILVTVSVRVQYFSVLTVSCHVLMTTNCDYKSLVDIVLTGFLVLASFMLE